MIRKAAPDLRSILSGGTATEKPTKQDGKKKDTERKERNLYTDSVEKAKFTTGLDLTTVERLRNAAWWAREPVSAIVERAILAEIARMEKAHGSSFPTRREELRRGRPVK